MSYQYAYLLCGERVVVSTTTHTGTNGKRYRTLPNGNTISVDKIKFTVNDNVHHPFAILAA